jgi:hypothetical protein
MNWVYYTWCSVMTSMAISTAVNDLDLGVPFFCLSKAGNCFSSASVSVNIRAWLHAFSGEAGAATTWVAGLGSSAATATATSPITSSYC